MRFGSKEWYLEKYKELVRTEAQLRYRDKLKIYLNLQLGDLKKANHPLYDIIKKEFPTFTDDMTIDEARMTKLFKKVFMESSMKALELTYRLDGSMSDLKDEPDYETVEKATEDIK